LISKGKIIFTACAWQRLQTLCPWLLQVPYCRRRDVFELRGSTNEPQDGPNGASLLNGAICLLFALYTVCSGLFPGAIPAAIDGSLFTVLLVTFALIHGAERYAWTSILVFLIICLVVSNASENLSILTGFPFGRYYYTDMLGPKLFLVPVLIGGAYAGVGYLSWIIAQVLLDRMDSSTRSGIWALPAVAAVLMVSWDLSLDPSASM